MIGGDGYRSSPPRSDTVAASSAPTKKRKKHSKNKNSHKKGPKFAETTETETLTLKPNCSNPISNRFDAIHPWNSRRQNESYRRSELSGKDGNVSGMEWNRKWVYSLRDLSACKEKVVVVSYNILGVENALKHPDLYVKVPPEHLEWDRRKERICREVNQYNADILCLQEVDRFDDLDDTLQEGGFRGFHKARTGEACDGCAIFWKDKLFTLLHEENIEFENFGLRNNVAQLCVLKMNKNQSVSGLLQASGAMATQSRMLVVGNIHVLFNPSRGDIKLGQVRVLLNRAHELSKEWGGIPVVLGGDLNSIPQSAIYHFLASSELDILLHDRRNISGQLKHRLHRKDFGIQNKKVARISVSMSRSMMNQWSSEEIKLATGSEGITLLQHQLKLCSAYQGTPGSRRSRDSCGEPLATSYHSKFMGTVDYIWHTEELVPIRVLETLPIQTLRSSKGLPNERLGSDHFALVCELAFSDSANRT